MNVGPINRVGLLRTIASHFSDLNKHSIGTSVFPLQTTTTIIIIMRIRLVCWVGTTVLLSMSQEVQGWRRAPQQEQTKSPLSSRRSLHAPSSPSSSYETEDHHGSDSDYTTFEEQAVIAQRIVKPSKGGGLPRAFDQVVRTNRSDT